MKAIKGNGCRSGDSGVQAHETFLRLVMASRRRRRQRKAEAAISD